VPQIRTNMFNAKQEKLGRSKRHCDDQTSATSKECRWAELGLFTHACRCELGYGVRSVEFERLALVRYLESARHVPNTNKLGGHNR
jgi:hypothetical protein